VHVNAVQGEREHLLPKGAGAGAGGDVEQGDIRGRGGLAKRRILYPLMLLLLLATLAGVIIAVGGWEMHRKHAGRPHSP
jgi:hypothetical protein